jgi:hypothetical protein
MSFVCLRVSNSRDKTETEEVSRLAILVVIIRLASFIRYKNQHSTIFMHTVEKQLEPDEPDCVGKYDGKSQISFKIMNDGLVLNRDLITLHDHHHYRSSFDRS